MGFLLSDQYFRINGKRAMKATENLKNLNIDSSLYKTRLSRKFLNRKPYKPANPKMIMSFIPGTVLDILVKKGQNVNKGDDLVILDAMKMQNIMKCNINGTIRKILIARGDKVSKGTILLELK
jgi:biotin carboxyl carrier protein